MKSHDRLEINLVIFRSLFLYGILEFNDRFSGLMLSLVHGTT